MNIIPFKVKAKPLPDDYAVGGTIGLPDIPSLNKKVEDKVWTVAGVKLNSDKDNPRYFRIREGLWLLAETELFLLIRAGEITIWYPSILCEVVEDVDKVS